MKGVVFTEFLEMVEDTFGYEMVDEIISNSDLESNGVYTSIGTYDHKEMFSLVSSLSKKTEIPVHTLLKKYAHHLGDFFHGNYNAFYARAANLFEFLESIENFIHVEVKKLYPDAELPTFETRKIDHDNIEMIYKSTRKMSDLAYGLIEKSSTHFKEPIEIKKENIEEDGSVVRFLISRVDG